MCVPSYPVLQVDQRYAVSEADAAGPLSRSPTILEMHDVGRLGAVGSAEHADY